MLRALGASGRVKNFRIQHSRSTEIYGRYQIPFKEWKGALEWNLISCFPRRPLEIGLFYSMPTCLSSWDLSGIEDESQKRALTPTCPTYYWKKKILHTYLLDTIQDFFSNFRIKWQLN